MKTPGFEDFSYITGMVGSLSDPPRAVRLRAGEIIMRALSGLKSRFPFVSILRRCVMPDHVHFAIFIKEADRIHLGEAITAVKIFCSEEWESLGYPPGERFFIDNYHDVILRGKGQKKKMLAYISDNPRRWLVRKANPGYFHRFPVNIAGRVYEAYGNWDLLSEPDHEAVSAEPKMMEAVRVSSRYSEEELIRKKKRWHRAILNDGVLVSPFIQEVEKRVRDWAIDNGGAIILLRAEPFGEKYKPSGRGFELCSEGRWLEVHVPVEGEKEEEYLLREKKPPRSACLRMNALAEAIASGAAHLA